jgi:hypothetical protein
MRGQRVKSIVAENLMAVNPGLTSKMAMDAKKKMCWKCQQDKSPVGGHIKTFKGGPMKFICKECMDAKKESQA